MSVELNSKDIKVVIWALIHASKMPCEVALDMLINEVQDWEIENFISKIIDNVSNIKE